MPEVNLNAREIVSLLKASKDRGTQNKALDLAVEYIEALNIEIERLNTLVKDLELTIKDA